MDLQRIEPPSAVLDQIVAEAQEQADGILVRANELAVDRLSLARESFQASVVVGRRFVAELQHSALASAPATSSAMPPSTKREDESERGQIPDVQPKPVVTSPRPGRRSATIERGRPRRAVRMARGARSIGIVLVLFCVYQAWGTGLREAQSQRRLVAALAVDSAVEQPPKEDLPVLDDAAAAVPAPADGPSAAPVALGEAFGMITIPKIGLEKVIVEGTGAEQLREGPGRYQGTSRPGEPGNAAIAGHRTTYGAPFRDLDELVPGDEIIVTTPTGEHRYVVSSFPTVVLPDANHVLGDQGDNRLTLTTCHPEYRASERLIVTAKPVEPATPLPQPNARPEPEPEPEIGPSGGGVEQLQSSPDLVAATETSAWATGALWSSALMVLWPFFLGLRWRSRLLAWLLLAPPGLFVLANLFESINRLLPAGI